MNAWWSRLTARERYALIGGVLTVLVAASYFLVWTPYQQRLGRLQQRVEAQRALVVWMEKAAATARKLRAGAHQAVAHPGGSFLSLIDRSARQGGLGTALKRVEPAGDLAVRLWLENVSFDDLLKWLADLEHNQGVTLESLVVDAEGAPGLVNARVVATGNVQ